jgi:SAM-dependent methyltransferase
MIAQAEAKAAGRDRVRFRHGDAADPPLQPGRYDVVLSRHVLWAMSDPAAALVRWCGLLRPSGSLVLVEGSWSTGAGLRAEETAALVRETGRPVEVRRLTDERLWGRPVTDERYLLTSPPP